MQRRNEVTRFVGAWGKKQVWRPHVRTWGLSETNVGYCFEKSVCDIVVTFWPPQWFGAHGIVSPFPPWLRFWCYAKSEKFSENKRMFKSNGHDLLFHEHLQFSNTNCYCMDLAQTASKGYWRHFRFLRVDLCHFYTCSTRFFGVDLCPVLVLQVIKLFQHQNVYFFEVR